MDQRKRRSASVLFTACLLQQVVECQAQEECNYAATIALAIMLTIVTTALFMLICQQFGKKFNILGTCFNEPEPRQEDERERSPYFTTRGTSRSRDSDEHSGRQSSSKQERVTIAHTGNVNMCLDVQGDLASPSTLNFRNDVIYEDEDVTQRHRKDFTPPSNDFSQAYVFKNQHSGPEMTSTNHSANPRQRNVQDQSPKPSRSPGKPPRKHANLSHHPPASAQRSVSQQDAGHHHGTKHGESSVEVVYELPPRHAHYAEQQQPQHHIEDEYTMAGDYPGGVESLYSNVQKRVNT